MHDNALKTLAFRGLATFAFLPLVALGCSVFMAANQPGKKDLYVLAKGTPRDRVVAELGIPNTIDDDPEGNYCHESYAFEQGYSGWTKGVRATFHLAADVFTVGLWELIGTPTELYFDGTEVSLEVLYDENDRVESVCVFKGEEVVEGGAIVSPHKLQQQLDDAREESRSDAERDALAAGGERLLKLNDLLESGLITEEEFEKKRGEILEELRDTTP